MVFLRRWWIYVQETLYEEIARHQPAYEARIAAGKVVRDADILLVKRQLDVLHLVCMDWELDFPAIERDRRGEGTCPRGF